MENNTRKSNYTVKGRPKLPEAARLFRTINFRVKQDKYDAYMEKFKQSGFPKQVDFFLAAVLKSETKNKTKDVELLIREVAGLKNEMRKIGVNANQVAKTVNTAGYAASNEEILVQLQKLNGYLEVMESIKKDLNGFMQSF